MNEQSAGNLIGGQLMAEDLHHLKVNGDKSRTSLVGNHQQHQGSLHQDGTVLPSMLHHEEGMETLTNDPDSIPTTVAQHGMVCDDRYDKYKPYDKYDTGAMEFNALSQRYLASDMGIAGGQGQLIGPAIGLHGLNTLASHPFSIQRLLPGAADPKSDVKMFDMGPYGGYSLGPGHGESQHFDISLGVVRFLRDCLSEKKTLGPRCRPTRCQAYKPKGCCRFKSDS